MLIVICGWRNTGVSVLIFSVSLLRAFLFRYCRDSVSSLQPRRVHRHIHRHGINYIQGAWLVGSHSPPTGESGVQDPHSHPGSLHPPVAAEQGPDGAGANRNRKNGRVRPAPYSTAFKTFRKAAGPPGKGAYSESHPGNWLRKFMKISAPTPEGCICPPPSFSEAWGMLPSSRNWPEAWIFW